MELVLSEEEPEFSSERKHLLQVSNYELPERIPSQGILPVGLTIESRKGSSRLTPKIELPLQSFSAGNVLLDLEDGTITEITDTKSALTFTHGKSDNLILIKNGGANDLEMSGYFIKVNTIIGPGLRLGEKELKKTLEKQALVSITTKDGQLVLPQTNNLGRMIITNPTKLASYISKNRVYTDKNQLGYGLVAGKVSVLDILWLATHRSMQESIAKYDFAEIMELPQLGLIRPEIQKEILQNIDKSLAEIGVVREPLRKDIKRRSRSTTEYTIMSANPNDSITVGVLASFITEELRKQTNDPHITYQQILELNPTLSSSEKVCVPPTIRMFNFAAFVESIYLDSDKSQASYTEGSTDLRWWINGSANKQAFNSPQSLDAWHESTYNKIQEGDFPELEQKRNAALVIECLPTIVEWWKELIKTRAKFRSE